MYQLLDERLIYSEMINESRTAWFQLELAVVKLCQLLSAPCSTTLLKKKVTNHSISSQETPKSQAAAFKIFGIRAVTINEDTP